MDPKNRDKPVVGKIYQGKETSLLDVLDRVVDKGAYVRGEAVVSLADVDLIYVGLQLVVSSVSRIEKPHGSSTAKPTAKDLEYIQKLQGELRKVEENIPKILASRSVQESEKGIAKLVLTLVELIRQLLEREAMRRVEKGNLSGTDIEKLGLTFELLEKKIRELKAVFGIEDELNIKLGPLGNLL